MRKIRYKKSKKAYVNPYEYMGNHTQTPVEIQLFSYDTQEYFEDTHVDLNTLQTIETTDGQHTQWLNIHGLHQKNYIEKRRKVGNECKHTSQVKPGTMGSKINHNAVYETFQVSFDLAICVQKGSRIETQKIEKCFKFSFCRISISFRKLVPSLYIGFWKCDVTRFNVTSTVPN